MYACVHTHIYMCTHITATRGTATYLYMHVHVMYVCMYVVCVHMRTGQVYTHTNMQQTCVMFTSLYVTVCLYLKDYVVHVAHRYAQIAPSFFKVAICAYCMPHF